MNIYTLGILVILFVVFVASGMRLLGRLRTNTTPTYYKILLVLLFVAATAFTVWQLFQSHIL